LALRKLSGRLPIGSAADFVKKLVNSVQEKVEEVVVFEIFT
jgi:hypothetical protein